MDVAKYILTALLLATFLGDMNSAGTIIASSIVLMLGMLGIGLWLVKKSSNNNKKKGK